MSADAARLCLREALLNSSRKSNLIKINERHTDRLKEGMPFAQAISLPIAHFPSPIELQV
jgi:hypothetical protein